jgi:co-chaperonin GroES (HSP10)
MRLYPLGTTLQILPVNEENITEFGIILPPTGNSNYRKGCVIKKGGGDKWNDMNEFHKGDMVQFSKQAGVPINLENEKGEFNEFLLVPYEKISGVL